MNNGQAFLAAVRGIPVNHVTKALGSMTSGVYWGGCSKKLLAESFDSASTKYGYTQLLRVDLELLAARARARAAGNPHWRSLKKGAIALTKEQA